MTHRNPPRSGTRPVEVKANGVRVAASDPMPLLPSYVPLTLRHALREARERLHAIYGDRLQRIVLYGSQARGDATEESDVDLLVVLQGPIENQYQEIKRAGAFWGDFVSRYGLYFSVKPYTAEEYQDLRRPFIRNVHEEGIEL